MDIEERLRWSYAMIWIPILFLILFSSYNYLHRITVENKVLKTEVKTKNNIIKRFDRSEKSSRGTVEDLQNQLDNIKREKLKIEEDFKKFKTSRAEEKLPIFRITSYDLSLNSCGKVPGNYWYGMTTTGFDLRGKSRLEAMCVASDPSVIPLNSRVRITFLKNNYSFLNGIYGVFDTGSAVKNETLDLFFGDYGTTKESSEVKRFGVQYAKVEILK